MASEKATKHPSIGGLTPVNMSDNTTRFKIEELARFAVDEHNKNKNTTIHFEGVNSAKQQIVAGTLYHINLEAKDGDARKYYAAKVCLTLRHSKELVDFKLIEDLPSTATA